MRAAAELVAKRPALFQTSAGDAFDVRRTFAVPEGIQYVQYQRTHDGLPVVGGEFVVVTDAKGKVLDVNVGLSRPLGDLDTRPSVPSAHASDVAEKRLTKVDSVEAPQLVVYAAGGSSARLAWLARAAGAVKDRPSDQLVYVDAWNGSVIDAVEQVQGATGTGTGYHNGPSPLELETTKSGDEYQMRNPDRSTGIECRDSERNLVTGPDNDWGNGRAKDLETSCVDALYAIQQEKAMLLEWFGRDGVDHEGGGWKPTVISTKLVGAWAMENRVIIGVNEDGQSAAALDVVGHEYGHGIGPRTSAAGEGIPANTLEFVADVFGTMTEHYANESKPYDVPDYEIAEEVNFFGDGAIRYMYDPSKDYVTDDEPAPSCFVDDLQKLEEHKAAGPGNHWFYLVAEGSNPTNGQPKSPTCDGSTVTGIGFKKASKIFYNTLARTTIAKWPNTYEPYRPWSLAATKDLYGCGAEFDTVKAAWDAVSVPQTYEPDPKCK